MSKSTSGSQLRDHRIMLLIIASVSVGVFLPTLPYQLTYYDDATLLDNMRRLVHDGQSFTSLFSQSVFGPASGGQDHFYRPVLMLSLYSDVLIYGDKLSGFHFTSILLHALSSCLLFVLCLKLKFSARLSFAASILFTIHPALVQAVAWIPGRNDILLTLFALSSLIFLIRYLEDGKLMPLCMHLLLFFMSLLTKETAVLLPVIFFITVKIHRNAAAAVSRKPSSQLTVIYVSWSLLTALFFGIRTAVLSSSTGMPFSFAVENLIINLPAIPQYIGKMMLPFNLSTFPILKDTSHLYGIITVVCLLYLLFTSKQLRSYHVMLGTCWMLLFLIPAILRTSSDYESVFLEHRLYFPLIGFILLLAETDAVKNIRIEKPAVNITFLVLSMIFVFLNTNQAKHYKDEHSYWLKAVSSSPNSSFAHKGLGTSYLATGKSTEAENEYMAALRLNPDLKEVRNNLGRIYLNMGQPDKAEMLLREEVKINPGNAVAYYNLALIRLNNKNISEAESLIRKSLTLDRNLRDAQNDLCVILAMQARYEEAVQLCIEILKEDTTYESAKKNLVLIFNSWDEPDKIKHYQAIILSLGISL